MIIFVLSRDVHVCPPFLRVVATELFFRVSFSVRLLHISVLFVSLFFL